MFANLREDISRYKKVFSINSLVEYRKLFISQSFVAILIYRFGSWCCKGNGYSLLRIMAKLFYLLINKVICEIILGIYLPASCTIGKGLFIGGFLGLVINPAVVIGDNCTLSHGVVIGTAGDGTPHAPKIGNNVYIGTGAVIIGGVVIGDNVRIGANAVVNKNVPSYVTVAGIPATIVKQ